MSATYRTTNGHAVTTGLRNAIAGPTYTYECAGCDGIRGYKTEQAADGGAKKHAGRCKGPQPAGGGQP